jgi:hypothetical protein
MKTRAAVSRTAGAPWEVTGLELDAPKGGHEGAGTVVQAHRADRKKVPTGRN